MVRFELMPATTSSAEPVWRALEDVSKSSFFISWDVVGQWLARLPDGNDQVYLVAGFDGSTPVAACLLALAKRGRIIPTRQLLLNWGGIPGQEFLTVDYNDVLIRPDVDAREILALLLTFVTTSFPLRFDEVVFPALADGAQILRYLREATPHTWAFDVLRTSCSPHVDLVALRDNGGDYLAYLGRKTRQHLRREIRHYEACGPVRIEVADSVDHAFEILDELIHLHQKTWQARGKGGAFARPDVIDFHRGLVRTGLPKGRIQLVRTTVGGETIGCIYNFVHRDRVCVYQSGFNYTEGRRPGVLSHYYCIDHNLRGANRSYEFLPEPTLYKRCLARESVPFWWCRVSRPGLRFASDSAVRALRTHWRRLRDRR